MLVAECVTLRRVTMNGLHEPCLRIAHGLAVAAALCGLYLMIVESIDLGLYGMMLFGLALGVEVIVGVHCHDEHAKAHGASSCPMSDTRPLEHRHH